MATAGQEGMKLPVPPKSFAPAAHDGGVMKNEAGGRATVHRFTDSDKSPAQADRVVKGLRS